MGLFKKKQKRAVEVGWLANDANFDILCGNGYTRLSNNPEVQICVNRIAGLLASMTIYLMQNTGNGDQRIKNELSRKIDIEPYSLMTRHTWIEAIARNLLLYGDGNSVVLPIIKKGYIDDLKPLPPPYSFLETARGYAVCSGGKTYSHEDVLHFLINPDQDQPYKGTGYRVFIKTILENLAQAAKTRHEFMKSKWRPSVIISVDGLVEDFGLEEGRDRIIKKYIGESEDGTKPWVIPDPLLKVEQVKPLSLADLAINDAVLIDKRTVADIIGVPAFFVGVGSFDKVEYNNFINTRILPLAQMMQQEMTKKLLFSPDLYFRFEPRSLYSYDIQELSTVGANMYTRGILTGNEVRSSIGYSPKEGLDELVILENYIPAGMIGDQKKLEGGGENDAKE